MFRKHTTTGRRLLALVVAAGMILATGCAKSQASFPTKPVELTVLFAAGSGADLIARQLATGMAKELKQPLPVVNKTGGGGATGYTYVKNAHADGYNVIWNSNSVSTAYHAGNMPFDHTAFEPVARLTVEPVVVTVKADAPWKSLKEFVEYAKQNPGKVRVGNSGQGSFTHLVGVALGDAAGLKLTHVPFGQGLAVTSLLGGQVEATVQLAAEVMNQVEAKQVRLLGVASPQRLKSFPETPTFKESGYDVVLDMWRGLAVPKGTSKEAIERLANAAKAVSESQAFRDFAVKMQAEVGYMGPADFGKLIASDDQRLSALMGKVGMKKSQ